MAEILRYAYASGDGGIPEFVELLIAQRDECLLRLDDATCSKLSDEILRLLGNNIKHSDTQDGFRSLCIESRGDRRQQPRSKVDRWLS